MNIDELKARLAAFGIIVEEVEFIERVYNGPAHYRRAFNARYALDLKATDEEIWQTFAIVSQAPIPEEQIELDILETLLKCQTYNAVVKESLITKCKLIVFVSNVMEMLDSIKENELTIEQVNTLIGLAHIEFQDIGVSSYLAAILRHQLRKV